MKRVLSILCMFLVTVSCMVGAYAVNDQTKISDWAKEEAAKAETLGLLDGVTMDDLTVPITREEFCTLAASLLGESALVEKEGASPFTDTQNPEIAALAAAGIVQGKGEGLFDPAGTLSREEMAAILGRMAAQLGLTVPASASADPYDDEAQIAVWAREGVAAMNALGVVKGTSDRIFAPKGTLTREQAVAALVRLSDVSATEGAESFAARLLQAAPADQNSCLSPLSVKMALLLAANGASGETQAEILEAVGIGDLDEANRQAKALVEKFQAGDTITLDIANSLWLNEDENRGLVFSDAYRRCIADNFGGTADTVDNQNAVQTINAWVKEHTGGKIDGIIDSPEFGALLANAIYFKGAWAAEFEPSATSKQSFTDAAGKTKDIDFMHNTDYYRYGEVGGARILELPYRNYTPQVDANGMTTGVIREDNKDVSMYLILGGEGQDPAALLDRATLQRAHVAVGMPKFKIEQSISLTDALKAMGLETAFDKNKADFTAMFDQGAMFMSDVLHKTYISVDEAGTEAAAVTAIVMEATSSMPTQTIEFTADHPFTYVIRDNTSGEVLFLGRYAYAG